MLYFAYLLHQSVIVGIGFYVVKWQMEIPQKFIIISSGALALTLVLHELIIRRFNFVRFCFGLKPSAAAARCFAYTARVAQPR